MLKSGGPGLEKRMGRNALLPFPNTYFRINDIYYYLVSVDLVWPSCFEQTFLIWIFFFRFLVANGLTGRQ